MVQKGATEVKVPDAPRKKRAAPDADKKKKKKVRCCGRITVDNEMIPWAPLEYGISFSTVSHDHGSHRIQIIKVPFMFSHMIPDMINDLDDECIFCELNE